MTMAVGLYPLLNPLLAPVPGIVTRSGLCDRAKGRFSPSHAGSIAGMAAGHWAPLSAPHNSVSPEPWGAQRGATARSALKNHCLLFFLVLDSPTGCCFLLPWGPRLLQPSDGHGEETGRAFPRARHGPVGSRTEEHPRGAAAFALQTAGAAATPAAAGRPPAASSAHLGSCSGGLADLRPGPPRAGGAVLVQSPRPRNTLQKLSAAPLPRSARGSLG